MKFTISDDISQLVTCHSSPCSNYLLTFIIFKHSTSVSQIMCCHPHLRWWRKKFLLLTDSQYLVSILKAVFLVRVITCSDNCGNVSLTATLLKMTQTMDWQGCQALSENERCREINLSFFRQSHGRICKNFFSLKNTWQNTESFKFTRP
jgi:hypothetical protein